MSVEREGGRITFQCDTCPDALDTDEVEFEAAWARAQGDGWKAFKVGGEWCHECPDCNN